jgi:arsenate reductase
MKDAARFHHAGPAMTAGAKSREGQERKMSVKIYHNPRCSKSRQTMAILQEKGIEPEVVEYLENPPSKQELEEILLMLDISPRDLMRRKEKIYKELELDDESLTDDALITVMVAHPQLIERPIVIKDGKAVLGRPPQKVIDIL